MNGNRPSSVLLLPRLRAYEVGQLLALYEHRTAVQGFVWNLNSFDQYGVELGKVPLCSSILLKYVKLILVSVFTWIGTCWSSAIIYWYISST
jgi:glucose-6-phosphate isomerase